MSEPGHFLTRLRSGEDRIGAEERREEWRRSAKSGEEARERRRDARSGEERRGAEKRREEQKGEGRNGEESRFFRTADAMGEGATHARKGSRPFWLVAVICR